ncbi:MAG TPA: TRAP transporter large permease [Ferrovibrio sp.]|uniref:TRAP transporter large permease n=1 Tax=Ferrovibrio sp. TaxID=1917215 RepID=UPI002ED2FDA8
MSVLLLFGTMIALLALGVPVAFSMGLAAFATIIYDGLPAEVVFQRLSSGMNIYSLLAIPFFIYAGELMLYGGIAERLVNFAMTLVGRFRGGLAQVNILSSTLFGGISGSAVADASALGSILIPSMSKRGYDTHYAVNVSTSAALIGIMIPPSHNMIIYSLAAGGGISIIALFTAGILPGLLMSGLLMLVAGILAVRRNYPREAFPGWAAVGISFLAAIPGLGLAVIILVGVRMGVFTVTESAAIGALYALIITAFVYRSLSLKDLKRATMNAVRTTAMVMLVIGTGNSIGWLLALHQLPMHAIELLGHFSKEPWAVLLIINVILLALGCVMDMAPLILICTPIFLPVAKAMGMDPVHFGMVLMINLGLGLLTPPVGAVMFVGCAIGQITIEESMKSVLPFYLALLIALIIVTYVPGFSLWLPHLLRV